MFYEVGFGSDNILSNRLFPTTFIEMMRVTGLHALISCVVCIFLEPFFPLLQPNVDHKTKKLGLMHRLIWGVSTLLFKSKFIPQFIHTHRVQYIHAFSFQILFSIFVSIKFAVKFIIVALIVIFSLIHLVPLPYILILVLADMAD